MNKTKIWRIWYLLAAWMTMSISLGVLFGERFFWFAMLAAAVLAVLKITLIHPIVHNSTELLMYSGIAVLLAPILSVRIAIALLILISLYDAYAVWKSKHMIKMAEFTKKSNLFPGFALTYSQEKSKTIIHSHEIPHSDKILKDEKHEKHHGAKKDDKHKTKTGILGGGDVIFPAIFTGAVFTSLIESGKSIPASMGYSLIVSVFAALSLWLLFVYGENNKFYPAMPFITAGCISGYLVMLLVLLF
jgi:presenilin-like A22 family membrane protease